MQKQASEKQRQKNSKLKKNKIIRKFLKNYRK